jgi:hypothetical protein
MHNRLYISLVVGLVLHGVAYTQTRPRVSQIRDIEQIRVGGPGAGDTRPGTLLDTRQIDDGRYAAAVTWFVNPIDDGMPTVCVVTFYRYSIDGGTGRNVRSPACYTQYGLAKLIQDPAWLAWWNAHKTDLKPAPIPPGEALVMDLLTHPRPRP